MGPSRGVGWKTRLALAIGLIVAIVFPAGASASGGGLQRKRALLDLEGSGRPDPAWRTRQTSLL